MFLLVVQDVLAFVFFKPVIAWNVGVVFVDFPVTLLPVKVFALADPDPVHDSAGRDFCFLFPVSDVVSDVVNDFVANVMGNPLAC